MSLSTQEFYIRQIEETEARGPLTLKELTTLAENGKADSGTLYYDAAAEEWRKINTNPALLEALFPSQKSLRAKAQENGREITVKAMLLAAGGRPEATHHPADSDNIRARAADFGRKAAMAILFINAAAYLLPQINVVRTAQLHAIFQAPFALLGLLNLGLGTCLALGAVSVYPWVRFAALLGLGFAGTLFALENQSCPLALSAANALGLYFTTSLPHMAAVLAAATLGLAGACGLAHTLFTT
jgi:hypothetical protein